MLDRIPENLKSLFKRGPLAFIATLFLPFSSAVAMPDGATAVTGFSLEPENYSYALVIGNNTKYMWILAREPSLEPAVLESLLNKARKLEFATDALIYPQEQGAGN